MSRQRSCVADRLQLNQWVLNRDMLKPKWDCDIASPGCLGVIIWPCRCSSFLPNPLSSWRSWRLCCTDGNNSCLSNLLSPFAFCGSKIKPGFSCAPLSKTRFLQIIVANFGTSLDLSYCFSDSLFSPRLHSHLISSHVVAAEHQGSEVCL